MMVYFITLILPLIFTFGLMYLIMIRPQKKKDDKRRQLINDLNKGTRVRTFSGIVGTVSAINENTVVIRSASSDFEILKDGIADVIEK